MKKILAICFLSAIIFSKSKATIVTNQSNLGYRDVPLIRENGKIVTEKTRIYFKDLNRNGKLDIYEDWRKTPKERAKNLISQLPLKEKTV